MTDSLNVSESARLAACELVIETGLTAFVAVGKALTEIRDSKLYRQSHKTFEEYCKAEWAISRPRAYELIGQAEVAGALGAAAGDLSAVADISRRDASRLRRDLPGAAAAVRQRVEAGEEPKVAAAAVISASRADGERLREEAQAQLPDTIRAALDDRQRRLSQSIARVEASTTEAHLAEIDELREANAALEADNSKLRADLAELEPMRAQYEQGGFAKVVAGKDEEIRVLTGRVEAESRDKVAYMRSADFWKGEAARLGRNDDIVIDMETGAIIG